MQNFGNRRHHLAGALTHKMPQRYKLRHMLNPQTLEREAMLKRIRELDAEIAQHERNLRNGEARLPLEEQFRLKLRRFIEDNIPELAGNVRVEIRR